MGRLTGTWWRDVRKQCRIWSSLLCSVPTTFNNSSHAPVELEFPSSSGSLWEFFLLAASPKISPGGNQDFPPDSMVTGSWNYSQVTVHVHGQEVLSEETEHPGAEPESPSELQDPAQTLSPEESCEETTQSPSLGATAEQSLCRDLELQPLQESGEASAGRVGGGGTSLVSASLGRL